MGIACDECTIEHDRDGQATVWDFETPPRIQYVDPDGPAGEAGLRPGDVLQQIDGMPITSSKGGRRFGAVRPGESVRWTYERAGKRHEVTLVAAAHPDGWVDIAPEALAEIEAAMERLRDEEAEIRRELDTLRENYANSKIDTLSSRAYADALRQMEAAKRTLEATSRSLRRQYAGRRAVAPEAHATPRPPVAPIAPTRHNLRFAGTIAGSQVEVHGSGAVVVTEDAEDEIVITTPDATIRIRKRP